MSQDWRRKSIDIYVTNDLCKTDVCVRILFMLGDYHMVDCKNKFAADLFWIKNVFRIILLETVPSIEFLAFFLFLLFHNLFTSMKTYITNTQHVSMARCNMSTEVQVSLLRQLHYCSIVVLVLCTIIAAVLQEKLFSTQMSWPAIRNEEKWLMLVQ